MQLILLVGGLGYLYLGQRGKAARTFGLVLLMCGLNFACSWWDWRPGSMVLGPVILVVQVLTALDAWSVAKGRIAGESWGAGKTVVPALRGVLGDS